MSRKDPRCVILVPLTEVEEAEVRRLARGRSMGDVVRRLVQTSVTGAPPSGDPVARRLAVQLPKALRAVLAEEAAVQGMTVQEWTSHRFRGGLADL